MIIGKFYRNREEACISGGSGCGVVYLGGCNMHCVYCLVHEISQGKKGLEYSSAEAAELLLRLQGEGVSHLSLANVEPSADEIVQTIRFARASGLTVPLLNNFNGYASEETMRLLMPHFEGYIMDFKYAESTLGRRLSGIPDYTENALRNLMLLTTYYGKNRYDAAGLLQNGVLLRHLILPGLPENTSACLRLLAQHNPAGYPLDLMADFVPEYRTAEYLHGPYAVSESARLEYMAMAEGLGLSLTL